MATKVSSDPNQFTDYYTSTGLTQSTVADSTFNTGIQTQLAPKVNIGMGSSSAKDSTYMGGILNRSDVYSYGGGNIGSPQQGSKPFFESFNIDFDKVYDFDLNLKALSATGSKDVSGPFKDPSTVAKTLGTSALAVGNTNGSLGGAGALALILNARPGVENPITGESSVNMIPYLDNLMMRQKYDKWNLIKQNMLNGDSRGYDMFRIGPHSFIRAQGEYNFRGNLGALGLETPDLHKIIAVSEGLDPRTYDYKTKTGDMILTYGNGIAGGYTLDGRHVDNRGQSASAGKGASDEFTQMAAKYFYGNRSVAEQWLASAQSLHKPYFGLFLKNQYTAGEKQSLKNNFIKFVNQAAKESGFLSYMGGEGGPSPRPDTPTSLSSPYDEDVIFDYDPPTSPSSPYGEDVIFDYDPPNILMNQQIKRDMEDEQMGVDLSKIYSVAGGPMPKTTITALDLINSNTPVSNLIGGIDQTDVLDYKRATTAAQQTNANFAGGIARGPFSAGVGMLPNEDNNNQSGGTGTVVNKSFQYQPNPPRQTQQGSGFGERDLTDPFEEETGEKRAVGGSISTQQPTGQGEPQQPYLVGGVSPTEVSKQQTVADDQNRSLQSDSFVVNAPAVEQVIINPEAINVAGVQDVRKMIMDAYAFARQQGLGIGNVDRGEYENAVDVALSKGELVVPPDLVKVIGKDRLEKINNRGKKEVKRRAETLDEKRPQANGMREGGSAFSMITDLLRGGEEPVLSSQDVNTPKPKSPEPKSFVDMYTGEEINFAVPEQEEQQGFIPASGGIEADAGLQKAMTKQYNTFANALNRAEWGGEHDTPEAQAEGYFLRTYEDPSGEGSSAYGPLQITGGLLASNFGNIKHLEIMKKNSLVSAPAAKMIATFNKGAQGALRDRLSEREKEFVDALIDQANLFLIYGKEEDRRGYDSKFDYGGKGNIQEVFPNDYKELYDSIGMILIESISETVDGDPEKFAKLWKAGDDPKKPFKDDRYLKEFTKNLDYLQEPNPIQ